MPILTNKNELIELNLSIFLLLLWNEKIGYCSINDVGAEKLSKAIKEKILNIKKLDLCIFLSNICIHNLKIDGNNMKWQGAEFIFQAAAENHNLRILNLGSQTETQKTIDKISEYLPKTKLETLNLGTNFIIFGYRLCICRDRRMEKICWQYYKNKFFTNS